MRVLVWVVLGLTMLAIVVGSLSTGVTGWPRGVSQGAKHFLAFAVVGVLVAFALGRRKDGGLIALAGSALFGSVVESLQLAVPARTFSFYDLGLNLLGCASGVVVWAVVRVLIGSKGSSDRTS